MNASKVSQILVCFGIIVSTTSYAIEVPKDIPAPTETFPQRLDSTGLTNALPFGLFEFNFNHPGARATGMGAAFIGLADDATAAITNPAGLSNIYLDEISLEAKYQNFVNKVPATENTPSEAAKMDYDPIESDDSVSNIGFLNYVKVTRYGNYSLFYRQPFAYKLEYQSDAGTGLYFPEAGGSTIRRNNFIRPQISSEATADNIGVGGAWVIGQEQNIRIGISLEHSKADIDLRQQSLDFDDRRSISFDQFISDDSDFGGALGLLVNVNDKLSVGTVYRYGPEYQWKFTSFDEDRSSQLCFDGKVATSDPRRTNQKCTGSLKTPDIFGLGVSYKVNEKFTIVGDLRHILYSQLSDNFDPIVNDRDRDALQGLYEADDITEIHIGAEYVFEKGKSLIPLRIGYYLEPAHKIHFDQNIANQRLDAAGAPRGVFNLQESRRFTVGREAVVWTDEGQDQHHITLGFGYVPSESVQFDFALNFSNRREEALLSFVKRFN